MNSDTLCRTEAVQWERNNTSRGGARIPWAPDEKQDHTGHAVDGYNEMNRHDGVEYEVGPQGDEEYQRFGFVDAFFKSRRSSDHSVIAIIGRLVPVPAEEGNVR